MDVGDQDVVRLGQLGIVSYRIGKEHAVSELEHNACVVHRRYLQIAVFRLEAVRCCRFEWRRRSLRSTCLAAATAIATTTTLGTGAATATTVTATAAAILLSETGNGEGKKDACHCKEPK